MPVIQQLVFLVFVCAFLFSSCAIPGTRKVTKDHYWNEDAQGVADRLGAKPETYRWDFQRVEKGDSILVHLNEHRFLVGSFDGQSYYKIVFQLPAEVEEGQEIALQLIPTSRSIEKVGEFDRLAPMQDGEMTAMKFGNPRGDVVNQVEEAVVKILSRKEDELVISLRLKAEASMYPAFSFDMEETFRLKRKPID